MRYCAIYARVSLEERVERFGLSSQLSELRAYAAKAGYEVVQEFVEDGYSGADMDRPALTKLREAIRSQSVSHVLVHDPDRLARKLAHQLILTEEFEKASVRLEFVTTPAADTMEGRLMLNVRGVIAEYEREKIKERTMRGRREKARQGFIVGGKRPYGYVVQDGVYRIDPEEAAVVVKIFQWLVEDGLSLNQIREQLIQSGYKPHTCSRWAKSSLGRLVRNELYIGKAYFNRRERIEGAKSSLRRNKKTRLKWRAESEWIAQLVPAIISVQLFQAAQARLKQNSAHCCGRPSKTVYLLRGILRCSRCGKRYVGTPVFGDKYYRCMNKERLAESRCEAPSIAAKVIEPFVWEYVMRLLMNPELLESKLVSREQNDFQLTAEAERFQRQIQEIQRREARLLDALLEGDELLPGMRQKARELEAERLRLQASHRGLLERIALTHNRAQVKEAAARYCFVIGQRLPNLDLVGRQKLLRALLNEVVVNGNQVTLSGILPAVPPAENRLHHQDVV